MSNEELIKCPKCASSQIHIDKRGFKTGRGIVGGLLTGNIIVAAAAGGIGMNKIELTCLKCGHRFKIGEHLTTTSCESLPEGVNINERKIFTEYNHKCPLCNKIYNGDLRSCPKCGRYFLDKDKTNESILKQNKRGCASMILIFIILSGILYAAI